MSTILKIQNKKVEIMNDGTIYVNNTRVREFTKWPHANRYSDGAGREIKDLAGKGIEEVLFIKGYLPKM